MPSQSSITVVENENRRVGGPSQKEFDQIIKGRAFFQPVEERSRPPTKCKFQAFFFATFISLKMLRHGWKRLEMVHLVENVPKSMVAKNVASLIQKIF